MRINKFFTEQGYCSRREADRLIQAGRVKINERLAVLGDQVGADDSVFLDGQLIEFHPPKKYIMYNKPLGITCTTDLRVEGNIIDAVKHDLRIFPIGRLDKYSTGLIFLTNDGDIVNKILRAQFGHEKEYIIEINCPVTDDFIRKMSSGVDIGGYVTKNCKVKKIRGNTFSIILTEGKNKQIRRMCEALDTVVKKLHRIRIINVNIGSLRSGEWVDIDPKLLGEMHKILETSAGPTDRSNESMENFDIED
jgi:23S rRNA pseudouridine2604 synthase